MSNKSTRKQNVKAADTQHMESASMELIKPAPESVDTNTPSDRPETSEKEARIQSLRQVLLIAGPAIVVVLGVLIWFTSGRYISTEDAYLKAEKVIISAQVSGPITAVAVHENQRVHAGDELFRIDDRTYRIALAKADAQLAAVIADISGIKDTYKQKSEELKLAETNREFAEREFARQSQLALQKLNSRAQLDEAKHKLDIARQQVGVTEQERAQYLSKLSGNPNLPAQQHPSYLEAKASRDAAALDLERTVIRAPFSGISSKVPQLGQYLAAGSAVMSVVGADDMWIEANFMETDLANVRVGQQVTATIDSYPSREWSGYVQSISQATGSEFSVLPPQNASGNWVKIVQRVPLRIVIKTRANDPPLRVGMTAEVKIDTGAHHTLKNLFTPDSRNADTSPADATTTKTER